MLPPRFCHQARDQRDKFNALRKKHHDEKPIFTSRWKGRFSVTLNDEGHYNAPIATTTSTVTVVGFPNDCSYDLTRIPSHSLSQSLNVKFGPSLGSYSCLTCIFADSNDNLLLDYYGRPIEVHKLLDDTRTPILPLKVSLAVPFAPQLKPTPTPQTTLEVHKYAMDVTKDITPRIYG